MEQFGRYTLIDRLGYGGMAEVFVAKARSIGGFEKLLAIKRLLPHCVEDDTVVDLLADEAKITVQLNHSNIVQVFDFGRYKDMYYLAMEYVDGLDLKTLIDKRADHSKVFPVDVALYITICVLTGLDFAHNRTDDQGRALKIIHRDVTPHNLLISRDGQVKLTDFGVARARISGHVSVVGEIRGKFSYMPPEQVCGGEIDHRVDIFAAGVILYELLSGEQPFRAASAGQQVKLLLQPLKPPSEHSPGLSKALDDITLKALKKDADQRYATAREFADTLRHELARISGPDLPHPSQKLAVMVRDTLTRAAQKASKAKQEKSLVMTIGDYDRRDEHSLIVDMDALVDAENEHDLHTRATPGEHTRMRSQEEEPTRIVTGGRNSASAAANQATQSQPTINMSDTDLGETIEYTSSDDKNRKPMHSVAGSMDTQDSSDQPPTILSEGIDVSGLTHLDELTETFDQENASYVSESGMTRVDNVDLSHQTMQLHQDAIEKQNNEQESPTRGVEPVFEPADAENQKKQSNEHLKETNPNPAEATAQDLPKAPLIQRVGSQVTSGEHGLLLPIAIVVGSIIIGIGLALAIVLFS